MLEQVKEFIVLASCLNFTKAAKRLHMSQPGLSRHIVELESKLGFQLLNREPVSLTPAGAYYLENVSSLIDDYGKITQTAKTIASETQGTVSIWRPVGAGMSMQIMMKSMNCEQEAGDYTAFVVQEDREHSALSAIVDNLVDIGMVYKEPENLPEGILSELLIDDPIRVALHKDNPLASKHPLYFGDLSACYLVQPLDGRFQDWGTGTKEACRRYGFEPQCRLKEFGESWAVMTQHRVDEMVMMGSLDDSYGALKQNIVLRFLDDEPTCVYPIYLLYRVHCEDSPLARFIAQCRKITATYRSGQPSHGVQL